MRPHKWSNPYRITATMGREQAIELYRVNLRHKIRTGEISLEDLASLHGRDLVCCCVPKSCHGHVLEKAAAWAYEKLKPCRDENDL
jgi:hypothetical protein